MTPPLVLIDADVLGRERTGDETYVQNMLRRLPQAAGTTLRFAAVTRRPELVPSSVEAIELVARRQEPRMAWMLPRLLRRNRREIVHQPVRRGRCHACCETCVRRSRTFSTPCPSGARARRS